MPNVPSGIRTTTVIPLGWKYLNQCRLIIPPPDNTATGWRWPLLKLAGCGIAAQAAL
jgi:hypothetical protein